MDINKALLLEIFMDRIGDQGTDTENRLERIGPGAQMTGNTIGSERAYLYPESLPYTSIAPNRNEYR